MIRADELDDGLVLDGEIYVIAETFTEWGACNCLQGLHRFAGPWRRDRHTARADALIPPGGHVVRRLVAITHAEEER